MTDEPTVERLDDPPIDRREPLADEFPEATVAEWEALVRAKAKDPEAPLRTVLEDGIEVGWLYTAADALAPDPGGLPGAEPFVRGTRMGTPWAIRQENGARSRKVANTQILEDLEGGATEVLLRIDPDGACGIPVTDVDQLDEVLDGVYLDLAPVAFNAASHARATAELLVGLWRRRDHPAEELRGSLRLDPIGTLARDGGGEAEMGAALELAARLRTELPQVQVLAVDTGPHVEAGAGAVPELALAMATGIAYLRVGEEAGLDPDALAATLEFRLIAGPDQFLEIAKVRAARRLWWTVLEHCDVPAQRRHSPLYVRTSRRMVSALDPWVNLLRATTAAFAAGVGGADGVTVLPFDEPLGEPGPLGRRMARNTQLVLQEEGALHRVADPAGGSWYVESLTDQLARGAWSQLQELERDGGIVAALASGTVTERLAADTARRHKEVARRRRALTGVNTFPLLGEPTDDRSLSLRTHSQTSGWSLAAQDAYNNVVRTCVEAMAATQGHTQSLHTNALDEALGLPTDFSARIARNTQLFLQQESGTTRVIDPWGGSYYVERLTAELACRALAHIHEIGGLGGMTEAIEAGIPKLRIEESAARTQARIDSARQVVVGVNRFQPAQDTLVNVLKIDNSAVRAAQIAKLERLRAERDDEQVAAALQRLTAAAGSGEGNLLELGVEAACAHATVGEISDALEQVYGRHAAEIRSIAGVYEREVGEHSIPFTRTRELVEEFEELDGRRPRILVAKMGQDGHDRGQKVIATAFADLGFDVDIGPLFQTPEEVARQAIEADVHIVGASSLAAGHLTLVPQLRAALDARSRQDILVVVGGVIPPADFDELRAGGADAIFPPGTVIGEAASGLVELLFDRLGHDRSDHHDQPEQITQA